jgi:hypothetical protein
LVDTNMHLCPGITLVHLQSMSILILLYDAKGF